MKKGKSKTILNFSQAFEGAAALIIATERSEFRTPDFELMDQKLNENKIIFDGRNLFDVKNITDIAYI